MNSQIFWLPWFCLICKLSWSRSCRAPFAPRRSCIVSRARLIQILTIRTLCLHRDFVSYPTQLIQILRGSQHEKLPDSLLCKRSTSYLQRSKILHNWPLQWVGTYTNVMRSIKRATCTRHKKHSWLQERTTSSRPMPRLNLNSLLNFPSACSCSNSIVSYSITSESHPSSFVLEY